MQVALNAAGQPDCNVTLTVPNGVGGGTTEKVPSCAENGGAGPCWHLETTVSCSPGQTLEVSPDPNLPSSLAVTVGYDCAK